ncbi:hypothetical protein [Hymenobacter rubripertinctus]|uniref:STAS/SEC14 domain-containing protein n=1 Tax=Hymenobacter rubripertinctus TaxID=2029981 RepID=A0A418R899_9BACT|nr:hypothetical protein [Hymenobacter rubripertinctus]RIY13850.1 hypothetical protein D0T11_01860 [Hymenobacter rubripertinctus]
MRQEFTNSFGETFLTTEFDSQNNWIYNDWQGQLTTENVMQGSLGILTLLRHTRCPYVLNDNRTLLGSWKQANDWLEHTWVPQALEAGLRYNAHIVAPGVFGQASAEDFHLRVDAHFQMRLFENLEEATAWLQEIQQLIDAPDPG